jgi:teichuronic acid biosynthesis glycosyltransferase TuaC
VVNRLVTLEHEDPEANVLVVTNTWPHAGEPRYGIFAKRQVESLIDAGLHCDVLFVRGFESPLAYVVAAGKVLRLSRSRHRRYFLVHGHGGETLLVCLLFLRGRRMVSFCGDDLLGSPAPDGSLMLSSRVRSLVLRQLSRMTSATITKSREMHRTLPARVADRNMVLPNGVNREVFRPIDRQDARRRLGWPADEHVALFAADPEEPRKRYALAAAACEHARRAGVTVRLHVANTEPPPLMPTIMSAADCLLLTSAIEGSPNVVKEAVTIGLPVVTTPAGDVREILEHVDPSYICEPDAEVLGDAVVRCVRNGGRSDGRERSAWLDQREIAKRLLGLYDSLV